MTTMNHQYLAKWFYSDAMIKKVLANNYITPAGENTNVSLINKVKNSSKVKKYSDSYEEQILKRTKADDLYKVINISGTNYKGFLVAIYDPSKVKIATSKTLGTRGQKLTDMSKDNNAVVAINASGFNDPEEQGNGGLPQGVIVKDGKIVWRAGRPYASSGGLVGITYDNKLFLTTEYIDAAMKSYKIKCAVEFGPFLIINGKNSIITGDGGWGIAPRTAIGQRKDGIILFLIIDGRRPGYSIGATMLDLTKIMNNYKAYNAINMDGGASTELAINNVIVNRPVGYASDGLRSLPNAWIVTK